MYKVPFEACARLFGPDTEEATMEVRSAEAGRMTLTLNPTSYTLLVVHWSVSNICLTFQCVVVHVLYCQGSISSSADRRFFSFLVWMPCRPHLGARKCYWAQGTQVHPSSAGGGGV